MNNIPIPSRMKRLPKDKRGYPIPYMIYWDTKGRPQFTINDETKRQKIIKEDLCSICGLPLLVVRWFVGGPLSAYTKYGAYIDPPMHEECAHYALRVCPFLAAPNYNKRIDESKLPKNDRTYLVKDANEISERPDFFVAVAAKGTDKIEGNKNFVIYVRPLRPYKRVEYWRQGAQFEPQAEIRRRCEELLEKVAPKEKAKKRA